MAYKKTRRSVAVNLFDIECLIRICVVENVLKIDFCGFKAP